MFFDEILTRSFSYHNCRCHKKPGNPWREDLGRFGDGNHRLQLQQTELIHTCDKPGEMPYP